MERRATTTAIATLMDLSFTEEQEALRAAARAFVESETTPALARRPLGPDVDRVWREMVALGWPVVAVPAELGGAGMSFLELLILLEEAGRGIVPGPLFATAGLFVPAVLAAAPGDLRERLLRGAAAGRTGTVALAGEDANGDWERPATTARRSGDAFVLSGVERHVIDGIRADGVAADEILVPAHVDGEGLALFAVSGAAARAEPLEAVDPSLRLATITLDGVRVGTDALLAPPGAAKALLSRSLQESTVAAAMLTVGTCASILDRTLAYARTREQFDQPIGRFQAVKHKLADMYVAIERARSLVWFAGLTIVEDDPRREVASSMAKAAAGDCQRLVVQDGLQLHGGIGYTWEYDLHLYLKRALSLEALLGSSRVHRRRIAERLGLR